MKFVCIVIVPCNCWRVTGIVSMQWSLHVHHEHWQHSNSAGQIELTWAQNGPVVFEKAQFTKNNNILALFGYRGLHRTNRKIGKIVTVHLRGLWREDQAWVHFVPQSVIQRLIKLITVIHIVIDGKFD